MSLFAYHISREMRFEETATTKMVADDRRQTVGKDMN